MTKTKTQTKPAAKKKATDKKPKPPAKKTKPVEKKSVSDPAPKKEKPKKFTKTDVKKYIVSLLQDVVTTGKSWLTAADIAEVVIARFNGTTNAAVKRYLTEIIKEGYVQERFVSGAEAREFAVIGVPTDEGIKKKEPAPEKPPVTVGENVKTIAVEDIVKEEKPAIVGSAALKAVCKTPASDVTATGVLQNEEELTLDETDTDTAPPVQALPEKSVRTKGVTKKYTRAESVLHIMKKYKKATPSEIIVGSNLRHVSGGGISDIRKQTQVYKIVALTLLSIDAAEIDVLGMFVLK